MSAQPGDTGALHAEAEHGPCRLTVRRVGADTVEVANIDIDHHLIQNDA
ncbi:MAG: hypothetical protein AAF531_08705 [Actinomycetota bacterium]